jgi:hypothetical protein
MWRFKSHSYYKFIRDVKKAIREWTFSGMVRTDVHDFFPSLQAEGILRSLWDSGCDQPSAISFVNAMMECEDRRVCKGMAIGPEASAVVGTYYLLPVDSAMAAASCDEYRYMDDIIYLHPGHLTKDGGLAILDEALGAVGVKRSSDKTHRADNPIDALALVERFDLAYVVAYMRRIPGVSIDVVKEVFDELIDAVPLDVPALRSCLNALSSSHDPHAVQALVERTELFDADPRMAADYLRMLPPSELLATELWKQLEGRTLEATRLHLLRSIECHGAASNVGVDLLDHATSEDELAPVRAWAITAYGRSYGYNTFDLLEATRTVESADVRRAAILTLRRAELVGRKYAARMLAQDSPDLALSASWALSQAAA